MSLDRRVGAPGHKGPSPDTPKPSLSFDDGDVDGKHSESRAAGGAPSRGDEDESPASRATQRRARAALRTFPEERSEDDLDAIWQWLHLQPMACQRFFCASTVTDIEAGATEKSLRVCQNLRLVSVPNGTTIYRQGEVGDSFHYILAGQVSVHHRPTAKLSAEARENRPGSRVGNRNRPPTRGAAGGGGGGSSESELSSDGGVGSANDRVLGAKVMVLGEGQHFGEVSASAAAVRGPSPRAGPGAARRAGLETDSDSDASVRSPLGGVRGARGEVRRDATVIALGERDERGVVVGRTEILALPAHVYAVTTHRVFRPVLAAHMRRTLRLSKMYAFNDWPQPDLSFLAYWMADER